MYTFGNGTDGIAQRAASTVVGDVRNMSARVERDRLIAAVVAGHVAFATVDAHVLKIGVNPSPTSSQNTNIVNDGHNLLFIVQITVGADAGQTGTDQVLRKEG